MNDNEQQLQIAWQFWRAGTGIDTEDMPPPNPSFKAWFDYGMVAAHNEHCEALIKVEELSGDAKKMAAIIGIKDVLIHRLTAKADAMLAAIEKTIAENLHLADGEVCTLIDLKRVLRGDFSPWTRIDYDDSDTWPDENRPCIVAWEFHPEHPDRHAMHVFNDVGNDMRLWQNVLNDEVHDWDGIDENPTHWRYAPEYQP